ncbi:AI-2E family transporter [Haloferula rosea]|uniref:AI-2E family transporter n=1 Tax=Haloferula rosea TaxID=490093 RepID=A0A934VHB4_9BACT|nr:AI-2E family transporter [Haloferula rosea]MBK1828902.1 AI-2E family transporter [Haloferula rosea]
MSEASENKPGESLTAQAIEVAIRVGLVLILAVWAFKIISPFINPVLWGVILAVAFYPLFLKVSAKLGNRRKLVGVLFILCSVSVLIVPSVILIDHSIDGVHELADTWKEGKLHVPPPAEKVRDWPVIGEKAYQTWSDFSENFRETSKKFAPQIKHLSTVLLGMITGVGGTLLGFTVSLILAGVFMISGESCVKFLHVLAKRLVGARGEELVALTTGTIRGVALGVVGTACIQGLAAGIGCALVGVPMPALWGFLVLMLGIMQLPPLIVLGPVAAYVFSVTEGISATLFLIWAIIINFGDGVLKPMLMGRGVDAPMLVILIGAIGGMLSSGIMGLFIGAVVVALLYKLFMAWLELQQEADEEAESLETAAE